jgi:hypothetical protein
MSVTGVGRRPSFETAAGVIATRRMAVLDELRVPYVTEETHTWWDSWASLSGPEPDRALRWFVGDGGEMADGWSLGSIRIWGEVASDRSVTELTRAIAGDWAREIPLVDRAGSIRSWVWRASNGGTILPFDPDHAIANLRSESYLRAPAGRPTSPGRFARRGYYAIRPVLPRAVQIALRRGFSHIQARSEFPRWPIEPGLHDLVDLVLQRVADAAGEPVPAIASWPRGRSWALVLTHDVETRRGRDAIDRVRVVEESLGFRSCWNLVPERYPVPDRIVEHLKATGCEVGVHGLRHDGRDLESWDTPRSRLPEMRRWARRWGAAGFRSPATHRLWEAMPDLGFAYDSSYPDTDPFEPMAGGCCTWLPFFNRNLVELPITLTQDHTLFVILRRDDSLWREKVEFLRARGGMALVIVHPDYVLDDDRLAAYGRLLRAYRDDPEMWTPLPNEVADWWRRRAATSLRIAGGEWRALGPAADEAVVTYRWPAFADVRTKGLGAHSVSRRVGSVAPARG